MKSNCSTARLGWSSANGQKFQLDNNLILTLLATGSSALGANITANVGYLDASAAGSKVVISGNGNGFASVFAGINRIFANRATVNSLEFGVSGQTFIPNTSIRVNNLILTNGTVNNSTNTITVNNGGTITRTAGKFLVPPIYGTTATDIVNLTIAANCTADNEILGTVGKIGALTINTGITYTVFNLTTAPGYYLSAFNGGLGYNVIQAPSISAPPTGNAPTLTTAINYSSLYSLISSGTGLELYTTAPTIAFSAPTVSAWVANNAYIAYAVVSNGSNYYICTTAGTSAASGGPTATTSSISDGIKYQVVLFGQCAYHSYCHCQHASRINCSKFIKQ